MATVRTKRPKGDTMKYKRALQIKQRGGVLTRGEAIELAKSGWWTDRDPIEVSSFQLQEERLCMYFSAFHEALTDALGRPVMTHELVDPVALHEELVKGAHGPDASRSHRHAARRESDRGLMTDYDAFLATETDEQALTEYRLLAFQHDLPAPSERQKLNAMLERAARHNFAPFTNGPWSFGGAA